MRRFWFLPIVFLLSLLAGPAVADTTTSATTVTWSQLDPGTDWAAQVINDIFPIFSTSSTTGTGVEATVIGKMLGELTGFVGAIATVYVAYSALMHVHRGAETSRLLASNQTSMTVVRIGFAAVLMFPTTSGFSVGQAVVVKGALWGVGMAKIVYTNAVQTLGAGGAVIAQPMVPGTKTVVAGLIQNELCRSLVNAASANANMVPEPTAVTLPSTSASSGYVSFAYNLAAGNGFGSPACGSVTIQSPNSSATNLLGVSVDQTQLQQDALTAVLTNDIAGQVQTVAQNFWNTKQASALNPLLEIMVGATADYQNRLTKAATNIRVALQAQITAAATNPAIINRFSSDSVQNQFQLSNLGWTGAGAYYLEFARLNGQTLSLLSSVPDVNTPSYQGFGDALSGDLAPLVQSSSAFLQNLQSYVSTQDGMNAPGGNADIFSGAMPGSDGASGIDQVARSMHLTDFALQTMTAMIEPSGSYWVNPFANLMALGNTMIVTALAALGAAGLLSSTTGTAGMAVFSLLSGNPAAAAATVVAHNFVTFLATPIMIGCMALLVPGLTIAFVLPMIPCVMWIAAVLGWFILVCEGVIAVPLWMLAHMTTQGEGLHGKAQEGYALLFNIIFRPTLMLLGLFLGYFIFSSGSWLVHQIFGIAAGFVLARGWLITNLLGVVVLLAIFVTIHVVIALLSFRMITLVPDHLPRLIGFSAGGRVDIDQFSRDAALVGVAGSLQTISQGLQGALSGGEGRGALSGPRELLAEAGRGSGEDKPGSDTTIRQLTDSSSHASEE